MEYNKEKGYSSFKEVIKEMISKELERLNGEIELVKEEFERV